MVSLKYKGEVFLTFLLNVYYKGGYLYRVVNVFVKTKFWYESGEEHVFILYLSVHFHLFRPRTDTHFRLTTKDELTGSIKLNVYITSDFKMVVPSFNVQHMLFWFLFF